MTPLRAILQRVNDAPHTTPAKRGLKIGARTYYRNVISDRGLFRFVPKNGLPEITFLQYTLEPISRPLFAGVV